MTWWVIVASIIVITLTLLIYAVFTMAAGVFIRAKTQNDSGSILFTFDDGPHPDFTPQVLALLEAHQRKAIFFCIGQNVDRYPDIVQKINDAGHILGNHTYSHQPRNTFASSSVLIHEINLTNKAIAQITGFTPTLFRPPYGITNPSIAKAIRHTKMEVIGWNNRSFDTIASAPEKIVRRVIKKLQPGCIILMHDTSQISVDALEKILAHISSK